MSRHANRSRRAEFDRRLRVNLRGMFLGMRYVLPDMVRRVNCVMPGVIETPLLLEGNELVYHRSVGGR